MPKRKRPPVEPNRPPPPPPPPKSLVNLLRSDKKVLQYFTLLQANLEADKQKWKGRATQYQKECEELSKKLASQTGNEEQEKSNKLKSQKKPAPTKKKKPQSDISVARIEHVVPADTEEAIDDDMFDTMFDGIESDDGEDDDDDDDFGFGSNKEKTPAKENPVTHRFSDDDDDDINFDVDEEQTGAKEDLASVIPFHGVYHQRLSEAHENMAQMGVALVDEEEMRRPNEEVLADLFHAIRAASRVPSRHNKDLAPFLDMIPACDRQEHPAYKVKQCAFAAVRVMDLFGAEMNNDQWNTLAGSDNLRIGLYNRRSLVSNLMHSLSGEISNSWPVADRSSRIVTTALHYDPSDTFDVPEDDTVDNKAEFGAKSQTRLSTLVERSLLVQLLCHYYDHRGNPEERVLLLIRYVISTAPSLMVEDYPKYPPVLSMCVIEAILTQDRELIGGDTAVFHNLENCFTEALQGAALAVHVSALIWKQRLKSNDDRVTDIARVNLASYDRILAMKLSWFGNALACDSLDEVGNDMLKSHEDSGAGACAPIIAIIDEAGMQRLKQASPMSVLSPGMLPIAVARSVARRQLEIRQMDKYRDRVGTPTDLDAFELQRGFLDLLMDMKKVTSAEGKEAIFWKHISAVAHCCLNLSDGALAVKVAQLLPASIKPPDIDEAAHDAFLAISQLSQTPIVRLINLKRRVDRRNAFQSQVKVESLLMVDGVVNFEDKNGGASYYWGDNAFDGQSNKVMNEDYVLEYVATHWRPSDLKAFDRDAPVDDNLVKMSQSERACALSHVSTWEGVRRSLQPTSDSSTLALDSNEIIRLFRFSGFARGKALIVENENMSPSPVCIIMEDDAILVDRFTDRLDELLQELPRDFHFCSLGYSRPKNAPVVPYSSQVGIPSCIWYLTGYILSLEGAKHLQKKLPVRGPVDSWIGLQMCANWENEYGQNIGVGMQSKPAVILPSRKDLEHIMKFRAFCALTPLCSQRVNAPSAASARRSWRQRDTDIVYSGH